MRRHLIISMIGLFAAGTLQGCASSGYSIGEPIPSQARFTGSPSAAEGDIAIRDARGANPGYFSSGVLPAELRIAGVPFEPMDFLRTHVARELEARGIEGTVSEGGESVVDIDTLRMQNHRTNAYTPFITLTMLSGEINTPNGDIPIGIFITRGKVPVWTFDEVIEPIFTQPMDLLVKELTAKINAAVYGQSLSDDAVDALALQIESNLIDGTTFLDVYQLGFGNNPRAIDALGRLARHKDQYVRHAAMSSLGILRSTDHIDFLIGVQEDTDSWSDRAVAIKALGDIGTPETLDYLRRLQPKLREDGGKENRWNIQITDLYLRDD